VAGESWNDMLDKTTVSGRTQASPHGPDKVASPAPGDDAGLPGPGDPYKAAGTPEHQAMTRLCCIMGREGFEKGGKAYRYFQYVHLDSDTYLGFTEQGQVIALRFAGGSKMVEVKVYGRNLLAICDAIHQHRLPWIRVADRDFRPGDGVPDHKPFITEIRIEEIRRPGE
jgi:hypothetical protein